MLELRYNLTFENVNLNEYMKSCALGIEGIIFKPRNPEILSIKVDKEDVSMDYIKELAEYIKTLDLYTEYTIAKATFIDKRIIS